MGDSELEEAPSPYAADVMQGAVVLVTGGGSGIGREIAVQFARHGASAVAILGRSAERLEAARAAVEAAGAACEAVAADVRSYDAVLLAVEQVRQRFGRLDVVVNAAAGNFLAPAETLSANAFATVVGIDLLGTFNVCRASYAALCEPSAPGVAKCILNVSATLHYGAMPWQSHACAAKAGVDALTRALCVEWGPRGVRVNGLAPGPVEGTEGVRKLAGLGVLPRDDARPDEEPLAAHVPLGRMATRREVALAAVFLCSHAAGFITGHTLVVDGGQHLHRDPPLSRDDLELLNLTLRAQRRNDRVASQL